MRTKVCLLLCALVGCASRQSFPSASRSDVIACRAVSNMVPPLRRNDEFNECMKEAGYTPAE